MSIQSVGVEEDLFRSLNTFDWTNAKELHGGTGLGTAADHTPNI